MAGRRGERHRSSNLCVLTTLFALFSCTHLSFCSLRERRNRSRSRHGALQRIELRVNRRCSVASGITQHQLWYRSRMHYLHLCARGLSHSAACGAATTGGGGRRAWYLFCTFCLHRRSAASRLMTSLHRCPSSWYGVRERHRWRERAFGIGDGRRCGDRYVAAYRRQRARSVLSEEERRGKIFVRRKPGG